MKIIAHRLISKVYPENSINSLLYLIKNGISAVEFDVCQAIDDRCVVAHPTSIFNNKVNSFSSLEEVVKTCLANKIDMFIDVKLFNWKITPLYLETIEKILREADASNLTVIISQFKNVLNFFHNRFITGYIKSEIKTDSPDFCEYLLIPITKLTHSFVTQESKRKKIIATQVNISNMELIRKYKIKNIMTDYAIDIVHII